MVNLSSDSSLVKKEHKQVKTKRYAGMDGNFLSDAYIKLVAYHHFIEGFQDCLNENNCAIFFISHTYIIKCAIFLYIAHLSVRYETYMHTFPFDLILGALYLYTLML